METVSKNWFLRRLDIVSSLGNQRASFALVKTLDSNKLSEETGADKTLLSRISVSVELVCAVVTATKCPHSSDNVDRCAETESGDDKL